MVVLVSRISFVVIVSGAASVVVLVSGNSSTVVLGGIVVVVKMAGSVIKFSIVDLALLEKIGAKVVVSVVVWVVVVSKVVLVVRRVGKASKVVVIGVSGAKNYRLDQNFLAFLF